MEEFVPLRPAVPARSRIVSAVAWTDPVIVSARAETIGVDADHGGSVAEYDARWSELAARSAKCPGYRPVSIRLHGVARPYSP
jgi:hypothetical protein